MVFVEHSFCIVQIVIVAGVVLPWQGKQGIEVGQLHAVIPNLWIHPLQLHHLLQEILEHFCTPGLLMAPLPQITDHHGLLPTTQFILNGLELLLQEVLTLLLIDIFARTHLNRLLQLVIMNLPIEHLYQREESAFYRGATQQFVLELFVKRDVGAGIVDGNLGIVEVTNSKSQFLRHIDSPKVSSHGLAQRTEHDVSLHFILWLGHLWIQFNLAKQIGA